MNFQMLEVIIKALLKVKDEVKKAREEFLNDKFNKGEKNESRN